MTLGRQQPCKAMRQIRAVIYGDLNIASATDPSILPDKLAVR